MCLHHEERIYKPHHGPDQPQSLKIGLVMIITISSITVEVMKSLLDIITDLEACGTCKVSFVKPY